MNNADEIGWVFIYVFAFGISDYIVKMFIKTDLVYILYYLLLAIIGALMICRKYIMPCIKIN
tara:strand:+ start:71 stop:256 length:186 start_codon:yes stop_codon:yes gene_type:complete